jgi:hypothetical protein
MSNNSQTESEEAIKVSYFNLLAAYFEQETIKTPHTKCLIKWGVQLGINPQDIYDLGNDLKDSKFIFPRDEVSKLESVYHLVHMIYLDQIVEDVELEVASFYATRLGFNDTLVGDLFKSIATTEFDLTSPDDVRKEVIDFLKIQKSN